MPWTPAPPIARARLDSVRTDPPSLSGRSLSTRPPAPSPGHHRRGSARPPASIVSMNTWPFENPIAVSESRSAADTRDLTSHHLGQRDQGGDAGDERQQPHPTRLGADRALHVASDELARLDAELGRARKWRQLTSQGRFVDARLNPDWDHRQCDADVGAVDQALREDRVRLRVIDRRCALEDADQRRRERELRGVRAEAVLGRALLRERVQIEAIAQLRLRWRERRSDVATNSSSTLWSTARPLTMWTPKACSLPANTRASTAASIRPRRRPAPRHRTRTSTSRHFQPLGAPPLRRSTVAVRSPAA